MDVSASLAARLYARTADATRPDSGATAQGGDGAGAVARDFAAVLQNGEDEARRFMAGGADPHALVEALSATELAVETAVTLRDKVVEAYQEILRMPV